MSVKYVRGMVSVIAAFFCLLWFSAAAFAQDAPAAPGAGLQPAGMQATSSEVTPDGFTVWRKVIGESCSYNDHSYTLDVDADPAEMSEISYSMTNYDVDYNNSQGCEGGPEVDIMYLNVHELGILTGANDSWSTNAWPLNSSQVISGSNEIFIDTDAPGTDCWCVGVGEIEIRAKLGFKVITHTPQADDKNRDFHAAQLDLTVTFSTDYDPATLTADTFLLEYRDQGGAWQRTNGSFTQLAPERFRFVPGADLRDGVRYRATIKGGDAGVKSTGGRKLDNDKEWYFWTVPDLSKNDAFDYGAGSTCPPSASPCAGVELAVFQVARNATMVPNKPAVARVYVRWLKHSDVLDADQVKELEVDATLGGGGSGNVRATLKRPDGYSAAEKAAAGNTANVYHTPGSNFNYTVKVTPQPQTNATVVEYTGSLNLASSGRSPNIRYNYYFLKDGVWAGGAPAATKTAGRALFTAGSQFMQDIFPVISASHTESGDYSIGYTIQATMTDTFAGCGVVNQVDCPNWWFTQDLKPEIQCVYDKLESMRGGNYFVAATVPSAFCPNTNGMAYRHVFVHFDGSGANYGTVVHETGHIYTLDHIDIANNIEGFQVRTRTNRSFIENPTNLASLMHTFGQPAEQRWIVNTQYATLLGTVTTSAMEAAAWQNAAAGPFLIVSGYIYSDTGVVELAPAFLQDLPNDPPNVSGACSIELLDASNNVLAADFTNLLTNVHRVPADPNAAEVEFTGAPFFSVSLPWNAAAAKLRVSCNGNVLRTLERSANAPVVDFTNLNEGFTLTGPVTISWSGSDADGPNLAYQLQFSADGGTTWQPLMPLGVETSLDVNTTLLPAGSNRKLRILVTDGFNTAYALRTGSISNDLTALATLPTDGETGVSPNTTVQVLFASDVDPALLTDDKFQLYDNSGQIPGHLSYDAASRMVVFTPDKPLQGNITHSAYLFTPLADVHGHPMPSDLSWSFVTGADTNAPFIAGHHPQQDEIGVPTNTLVQVNFSEPMNEATLDAASVRLLNSANQPVAGAVSYDTGNRAALLIPDANLQPNADYRVQVSAGVQDTGGNALGTAYEWQFTTGVTATLSNVRIVGNYGDSADDLDGDGLYDQLRIFVDVEVREVSYYNLNGRLTDSQGNLIHWTTTGDLYLTPGVHTLALVFPSAPIRSYGVDGSYFLDSLSFYESFVIEVADRRSRAYQTFPYDVEKFYSILTLGGLPDQLLEVNTTRGNAFNLHDYTTHRARPLTDVTYSILINTNPTVGVSIDGAANVDIIPPPDTEVESFVTIEAVDPDNNRVTSAFQISVQRARASQLAAGPPLTATANSTIPISVTIGDQFGRVFTQPVSVTAETTLGSIEPPVVETTNGVAEFILRTGDKPGTAFITLSTAGGAKVVLSIQITAQPNIYLPFIRR